MYRKSPKSDINLNPPCIPHILVVSLLKMEGMEKMKLFENNYRSRLKLTNDQVFYWVYGMDTEESKRALIALLNVVLDRKDDPHCRGQAPEPGPEGLCHRRQTHRHGRQVRDVIGRTDRRGDATFASLTPPVAIAPYAVRFA